MNYITMQSEEKRPMVYAICRCDCMERPLSLKGVEDASVIVTRDTADMIHQVPEHYCYESERLSNILDNVGYSQEDRDRKVTVATETEVFYNMANALKGTLRSYIFGSRGEGSTEPELQSDMDSLYESTEFKVVTDLSQCQPEMTNFLMVKDNHTHPGYVKLQRIIISPDYTPVPVYLGGYIDDVTTIDSLNRIVLLNTAHHDLGTVFGPAYHYHCDAKELAIDVVYALRCSQWPLEGYKWFLRRIFTCL